MRLTANLVFQSILHDDANLYNYSSLFYESYDFLISRLYLFQANYTFVFNRVRDYSVKPEQKHIVVNLQNLGFAFLQHSLYNALYQNLILAKEGNNRN